MRMRKGEFDISTAPYARRILGAALTAVTLLGNAKLTKSLSTWPNNLALAGKKALVTGSSGGIGKGIALKLASHGANVLVHYNTRYEGARDTSKSIAELGVGSCDGILKCDFRSPHAMNAMFDNVDKVLGGAPLDILVNNAGLITKLAVEDDDDDLSAWHETMKVNLHAPLHLSRLAFRRMKRSTGGNGGVIVNVSSIHGSRSVEYMTAYAVSKAGLDSLTRGLALEYASEGVRVNAIAPGIVPVERTATVLSDPSAQAMWEPHLPVGRMGTVEEIGAATVQLCTNGWMSGTVLSVDGGMMARANMPRRPRPPRPTAISPVSSEVQFERP